MMLALSLASLGGAAATGAAAQYNGMVVPPATTPPVDGRALIDIAGVRNEGRTPIELGPFAIEAEANAGVGFEDNIRAAETDELDDYYGELGAEVISRATAGVNKITTFASGAARKYDSESDQDFEEWAVGGRTLSELSEVVNLQAGLDVRQRIISRENSRVVSPPERPVQYLQTSAFAGIVHDPGVFRTVGSVTFRKTDIEDVVDLETSTIERFEDSEEYVVDLRVDYRRTEGLSLFTAGEIKVRTIDALDPSTDFDSTAIELLAGVAFEPNSFVRGEVSVGFLTREFESDAFDEQTGGAFAAEVIYQPLRRLSFALEAGRGLQDSVTAATAASAIETSVAGSTIYDVNSNLQVFLESRWRQEDFDEVDVNIERGQLSVGSRIDINRSLDVETRVSAFNQDTDSEVLGRDFDAARAFTTLSYKF